MTTPEMKDALRASLAIAHDRCAALEGINNDDLVAMLDAAVALRTPTNAGSGVKADRHSIQIAKSFVTMFRSGAQGAELDCNAAQALALSIDDILAAIEARPITEANQQRVAAWMLECFTPEISEDKVERADRFIEEALELAQATGWTSDRGHALVDYVFGRPVGEIGQEVGGVTVTLAALCNTFGIDVEAEATREIDRITQPEIMLKIRAKQATKPVGSALPAALSGSIGNG